jgi:hypothetical protein
MLQTGQDAETRPSHLRRWAESLSMPLAHGGRGHDMRYPPIGNGSTFVTSASVHPTCSIQALTL